VQLNLDEFAQPNRGQADRAGILLNEQTNGYQQCLAGHGGVHEHRRQRIRQVHQDGGLLRCQRRFQQAERVIDQAAHFTGLTDKLPLIQLAFQLRRRNGSCRFHRRCGRRFFAVTCPEDRGKRLQPPLDFALELPAA